MAVTIKKSVEEFLKHIHWTSDIVLGRGSIDWKYYFEAKHDLGLTLLIYRGIRLRDIKNIFQVNSNYDLDLQRIKMESWVTFLISCSGVIEFKRDIHKDEIYLFASEEERRNQVKTLKHIQLMINATPKEKGAPNPEHLVKISIMEVFVQGYMIMADGHPMQDPRIPNQELGVAAKAVLSAVSQKGKKKEGKAKKSFEEQIANSQRSSKPVETIESTAPLAETQTGSILSLFNEI